MSGMRERAGTKRGTIGLTPLAELLSGRVQAKKVTLARKLTEQFQSQTNCSDPI